MSFLPILALVATAPATAAAAPSPPVPKWVLNYAGTYCILSRDPAGDMSGVAFRTRPFSDEHDLLLLLSPTGAKSFTGDGVVHTGGIDGLPRYVSVGEPKGKAVRLVDTVITTEQMERLAVSGNLRVTVPGKLDESVTLANMAQAMKALHLCEDDLAKRWNVQKTWVVPPKPTADPRNLFSASDYPSLALDRGRQGGVRVLLSLDATGAMSDCRLIEGSGDASIDAVPCRVFRKRAKFTPALDANGRPVASAYLAPIVRFMFW
jgi:TonB family protein